MESLPEPVTTAAGPSKTPLFNETRYRPHTGDMPPVSLSFFVVTRDELEIDFAKKEEAKLIKANRAGLAAKRKSNSAVREAQQAASMWQKQCDKKIKANRAKLNAIRE